MYFFIMRFRSLFVWVSIYAIAMAFLESSVVVYLREILYPGGFDFPLATMEGNLALTEVFRELSTLVMLIAVAMIAGKKFSAGFAWFIYSFAIWDIFYYLFLWILIGWPSSFFDWDILFLIPVTWTGPVLSPLIVCLVMISFAAVILFYSDKGINTCIRPFEWLILISGAIVVIISFTWDYSGYILEKYSLSDIWNFPSDSSILDYASGYVPRKFNWWLFSAGLLMIISAIVLIYRRLKASYMKFIR